MFLKANWKPERGIPIIQIRRELVPSQRIIQAMAAKGSFVIVKGAQLYSA